MTSTIKVDTISENTSANGVTIDGLTIKDGAITATTGTVVFNEASADVDFRVESNGNTHMLFVDGGNNRVGIGTTPDLGDGLHIRKADSGQGTANANFSNLVIENSAHAGISILTGTSSDGAIYFGDSGGNSQGQIKYLHASDAMQLITSDTMVASFHTDGIVFNENGNDQNFRIESSNQERMFFVDGGAEFVSTGESAPDVSRLGLCLNQAGNDGNILSFKSSDIAHGMTSNAETDTYAEFVKQNASIGGLAIHTYSAQKLCMDLQGHAGLAEESSPGTSSFAPVRVNVKLKSGTGGTALGNGAHLFCVSNDDSTKFMIDGDGTFHSDGSGATYDIYEDAQLVRAFDLSHGKGVIDSKFDKFISYNHEKLAELKLVGREKDGTPNYFINYPAFNRLHNGAIWQQYEKHQKLASAFYKLAEKTIGKEEADKLLIDEEIQLLN